MGTRVLSQERFDGPAVGGLRLLGSSGWRTLGVALGGGDCDLHETAHAALGGVVAIGGPAAAGNCRQGERPSQAAIEGRDVLGVRME